VAALLIHNDYAQSLAEILQKEELHHKNLLKALQFICTPVKFAVARNFYKNSWITAEELASFLPTYKTHEDQILDAKRLLNDDTKSVTSSQPISPSMEIEDEIEASSHSTTSTSTTQNN
ncbi:hypothetical protein INT45_014329, partial [Circinella minor]